MDLPLLIALIVSVLMSDDTSVWADKIAGHENYGTVLDVAEGSFGCTTFVRLAKRAGLDKSVFGGKGKYDSIRSKIDGALSLTICNLPGAI